VYLHGTDRNSNNTFLLLLQIKVLSEGSAIVTVGNQLNVFECIICYVYVVCTMMWNYKHATLLAKAHATLPAVEDTRALLVRVLSYSLQHSQLPASDYLASMS
jgi:hypothetical protein